MSTLNDSVVTKRGNTVTVPFGTGKVSYMPEVGW